VVPLRSWFVIGLQDAVQTADRELVGRLIESNHIAVATHAFEYRNRSRLGKELDCGGFIRIGGRKLWGELVPMVEKVIFFFFLIDESGN
jgi:hypothetical protein